MDRRFYGLIPAIRSLFSSGRARRAAFVFGFSEIFYSFVFSVFITER